MELRIVTIYNKKNGFSNGIELARKSEIFKDQFIEHVITQNKSLSEKGQPTLDLNDFEVREIGVFDDETTKIKSYDQPIVVPMIINDN